MEQSITLQFKVKIYTVILSEHVLQVPMVVNRC